jgi:hypothetical protein
VFDRRVAIITPVFNDWAAFAALARRLETVLGPFVPRYDLVVVDDGSAEVNALSPPESSAATLTVLRLACNLGHQRAVAVGLIDVLEHARPDVVVVMDADGEDKPEDVPRLLQASADSPGHVICAARASRTDSWVFKVFYQLYKLVFRQLTGARIDFGNFCAIPASVLPSLAANSGIWNNLPATLTRSGLPIVRLSLDRGARLAGQSRMNFVALVLHGLSAISVFADVVLIRILLLSVVLVVLTTFGLAAVVTLRWFTTLAIPGWASNVAGSLLILLFQSVLFGTISAFLLLSSRSTPAIVPRSYAPQFIVSRLVFPARAGRSTSSADETSEPTARQPGRSRLGG